MSILLLILGLALGATFAGGAAGDPTAGACATN